MKDTLLVTLADRNFINQAKQLFSSVYWNAGWKGDYMLLAHEIPEKDLKWFRNKGILVKKCRPLYKKGIRKYSIILADKFYLFTPEFKKWKNIVYLDADIIVRASLDRLARVKGFQAVRDFGEFRLKDNFLDKTKLENFNPNYHVFNGGVFAFSTYIIKENTFFDLVCLFKKYIGISKYEDQPILNMYFYKKWKRLSSLYNISPLPQINSLEIKPSDLENNIVLHFTRQNYEDARPWNPKNPFYKEWKRNFDKADLIDLNNIPNGKEWSNLRIAKESLLAYHKYFIFLRQIFYVYLRKIFQLFRRIYQSIRNFIVYRVVARLKVIPDRILGIMGQLIKRVSPDLYYNLKGKNGTKKS